MKSVIVGTAGHIDHGKTSLVKALTGIDADRLEEEKRRGITIDIGFAHLDLPAPDGTPLHLGFVDVPGHERFVRNMLAGVGGIDLVLLVIAADEGVKPQTREHVDICRLLGIRRGLTVLNKADLVDRESFEVVRMEVEEFLRGSFLDGAPILPISSRTGAGLDELKRELARVAAEAQPKDSSAIFRLPIDRVFSMKGFGTVITGTLISGAVKKEQEVEVFPSGARARVRGVQVHGAPAEQATAGQRTALNLSGIEKDQLARGMVLAEPGLLRPTRRLDAQLSLLQSAKPLKDRAHVHFHAYTAEMLAEVALIGGGGQLAPGQSSYVQLKLAEETLLLPGDRFIVRQFSPVVTIGGGTVLDVARPQKRADPTFLELLESGDRPRVLKIRVAAHHDAGGTLAELTAETGWRAEEIERLAQPLVADGKLLRIGDRLVHPPAFEGLKIAVLSGLDEFHNANPLATGINRQELFAPFGPPADVANALLSQLAQAGNIDIAGELVRLSGRGVVMKDEEAEAKQIIEKAFADAGLKVPLLKDVLAGVKVDRARAQKIVTLLLRDRVLIKLADDLVFHRDALDSLRRNLSAQKAKTPKLNVAQFKDLTGVSRKYAIPLLEYLDRERVTRRVGDERVIL